MFSEKDIHDKHARLYALKRIHDKHARLCALKRIHDKHVCLCACLYDCRCSPNFLERLNMVSTHQYTGHFRATTLP